MSCGRHTPAAPSTQTSSLSSPPHPRSNRFVDVLEESIHEWVRQQAVHTRPVSIGGEGGPHTGGHSDFEDDHSSECLPLGSRGSRG